MNINRPQIIVGLLIIWLVVVLSLFYAIPQQKPFTLDVVYAVSDSLLNVLALFWICLLGGGLGYRCLSWLKLEALSTAETVVLSLGLGLGGLGLVTFGLGVAGWLYQWVFLMLSLGLSVMLWPSWQKLYHHRPQFQGSWPSKVIMLYLGLMGSLTLLMALLPPTDWDGLLYHLNAPKLFIDHQRIVPGIDIHPFYYPFLSQMQFIYLMLLTGDIAAKLLHVVYGVLLTALIYLLSWRHLHPKAAWPSLFMLLSMPMVTTLATWAYNDLTLTFYQLVALYALLWVDGDESATQNRAWLILSGIFTGFAMGLKYTSFICPLILGTVLLWKTTRQVILRSDRFQANLKLYLRLLYFVLPMLIVACPWYIKNYFFMGNPVYPFVFGGLFWDEFRTAWYQQAGTGIGWNLWAIIQLPVLTTLGIRDVNFFDGRTGPLFLIFSPLVLLYGLFRYRSKLSADTLRPPAFDMLLIFAAAQFFFWMLGVINAKPLWQSRLLLPGLATLAPIIGWIWFDLAHLKLHRFSVQRFITLAVMLVLCFNLIQFGLQVVQAHPLTYLTGQESRTDYLLRRLGTHYAAMQRLNETVPPEGVVLFLWEPRSYYCEVDCQPDAILDRLAHDQYKHDDAAGMVAAWHDEGITHVLLFRQGLNFVLDTGAEAVSQPAIDQLAIIEREYLTELFDIQGSYQLYALK